MKLGDVELHYMVLRHHHADGSYKSWAFADPGDGTAEVRWGRGDRLTGTQSTDLRTARTRADAKIRKGYRHAGTFLIGTDGVLGRQVQATLPPQASSRGAEEPRNADDVAELLGDPGDPGFY